jgi:hypothetical protein
MFTYNHDQNSDAISDRRAFVLFHPEDHMEELELITRWLLMHHVEVYSFWSDGAWKHFKEQIAKGGTGVIIVRCLPPSLHQKLKFAGASRFRILGGHSGLWRGAERESSLMVGRSSRRL